MKQLVIIGYVLSGVLTALVVFKTLSHFATVDRERYAQRVCLCPCKVQR